MDTRHKEILQENRVKLVEELEISDIINYLFENKVLNDAKKDEIMSHRTRTEKSYALLDILPRRGPMAFQTFCEALRNTQHWLADILESADKNKASDAKARDEQQSGRPHPAQRIRPRNLEFKGRKPLLRDIHRALTSGSSATLQLQTIHGLGGVGKTEIVTEFAHMNKELYDLVRWINADTTSLLPAFREFAEDLGIEIKDQNIKSIVLQVFRNLKTINKWLLIYDNAPDYEFIKDFLPKLDSLSEKQHILVTSRSPEWKACNLLDVFTPAEAIEFIKSQRRSVNDADCSELAEMLGYLPLALRTATQYCNKHNKTLQDYLQLFKENQDKLLEYSFCFEDESEKTVMTTWITSKEKIGEKSTDAENLLYWCAFLSPDNIPLELFKHKSLLSSEISVDEATEVSQSYSMVSPVSDAHCINMHRLVQFVIRHNLAKSKDNNDTILAIKPLVECLTVALPRDLRTRSDFRTARKYFPHIKSLMLNIKDYISGMSDSVEKLLTTTLLAMIDVKESKDGALMIGKQLIRLQEEMYGPDSCSVM